MRDLLKEQLNDLAARHADSALDDSFSNGVTGEPGNIMDVQLAH